MSHDDDDPENEDRESILRRRKRFITSALLGIASTSALGACQPCLSPPRPPDSGTDGGSDAGPTDGGVEDGAVADGDETDAPTD